MTISEFLGIEEMKKMLPAVPEPLLILPHHSIVQVSGFMQHWGGHKVALCRFDNHALFVLRPEALLLLGPQFVYCRSLFFDQGKNV